MLPCQDCIRAIWRSHSKESWRGRVPKESEVLQSGGLILSRHAKVSNEDIKIDL